jgi:ferrochelatase
MQITSLADIVEGKIQNFPAISFITQIHTDISKVNEGDAYLALDNSTVDHAIDKGAFAIIYESTTQIEDEEIAWIQVDDIKKAITNVLRYKLLPFQNQYIHTNKIFFKLLTLFKSKELQHVMTLKEDISSNFEKLNTLEENKVIFSTDLQFLENISSDVVRLKHQPYPLQNLTQHSLFETTFSYKENFFDKIKLPRVYVDYLLQQLELFEYKLDLRKLNGFDLFKPIFINKSEQIVPFGQTNRFIIANEDQEIAHIEIEYLQTNYSYAKVQIADAANLNKEQILQIIQNKEFNALYFQNTSYKDIVTILQENDNDKKLL